jgi:hypothetical protein
MFFLNLGLYRLVSQGARGIERPRGVRTGPILRLLRVYSKRPNQKKWENDLSSCCRVTSSSYRESASRLASLLPKMFDGSVLA